MGLEQRIFNGNRAREVLENEAYQQAFDDIKREIALQWETSPARDAAGREELHKLLCLTNKLQSTLQSMLTTGKMAADELKRRQTLAERVKSAIS